MNYVEPIRDKNIIDDMCTYLKNKNKRDCILFMSGIYIRVKSIRFAFIQSKRFKNEKENNDI